MRLAFLFSSPPPSSSTDDNAALGSDVPLRRLVNVIDTNAVTWHEAMFYENVLCKVSRTNDQRLTLNDRKMRRLTIR